MDGKGRNWSIELGIYPGILLGFRTYESEDVTTHVLYMPLVDIAFIIENDAK